MLWKPSILATFNSIQATQIIPVANLWKTLDTIKIEQLGKCTVQIGETVGPLESIYQVPSVNKNFN
jgi:hypothetical protein